MLLQNWYVANISVSTKKKNEQDFVADLFIVDPVYKYTVEWWTSSENLHTWVMHCHQKMIYDRKKSNNWY